MPAATREIVVAMAGPWTAAAASVLHSGDPTRVENPSMAVTEEILPDTRPSYILRAMSNGTGPLLPRAHWRRWLFRLGVQGSSGKRDTVQNGLADLARPVPTLLFWHRTSTTPMIVSWASLGIDHACFYPSDAGHALNGARLPPSKRSITTGPVDRAGPEQGSL